MEAITMTFLRVIKQNDICNLLLKHMDIANRKFSYNRNSDVLLFWDIIIAIISMYSFWIINLFLNFFTAEVHCLPQWQPFWQFGNATQILYWYHNMITDSYIVFMAYKNT